jgi:hypothetical protein
MSIDFRLNFWLALGINMWIKIGDLLKLHLGFIFYYDIKKSCPSIWITPYDYEFAS